MGNGHKDTLWSAYCLAKSLYQLGKVQEAEAMYRRTIQGMEKLYGKERHYTLSAINRLAEALDGQEEYQAAEEMYPRAIEDGQC